MNDLGWDDLRIFLLVADTGGLTGAARCIGLSPATVGRRMLALEQRSGRSLFLRSQQGYALTPEGTALLVRVRAMQAAAVPVESMLSTRAQTPVIRLSAGTGTAMFLADRFSLLSRPGDPFRLAFVTSEAVMDIAHREVDLGIRNRFPESGNLAARRLALLRFAPYRAVGAQMPGALGWVAMDPAQARHPAAHWVHAQGHDVRVLANSVATLHRLIRAGSGLGVMPCMIADRDPGLVRAGPVIEDLTEHQYLVMHDDDRHRPPLRRLIARILRLYRANAALLAGEWPLGG